MERHEILDAMGELKLHGMRASVENFFTGGATDSAAYWAITKYGKAGGPRITAGAACAFHDRPFPPDRTP